MHTEVPKAVRASVQDVPSGALFFAIGAITAILGIVACANLLFASIAATIVIEVAIFGAGLVMLAHAFGERRHARALAWLLLAALYLGSSIWLILNPEMAIRVLTLGVAVLMFATGVVRLTVSLARHRQGWQWLAFSGLIGIGVAILLGLGWPDNEVWVLGLLLAADMLLQAVGFIAIGFAAMAERRSLKRAGVA